jgi:hypothetical protein
MDRQSSGDCGDRKGGGCRWFAAGKLERHKWDDYDKFAGKYLTGYE